MATALASAPAGAPRRPRWRNWLSKGPAGPSHRTTRVGSHKLNEKSDDDCEPRSDLDQPVGGLSV
jgi:hypothetical protein